MTTTWDDLGGRPRRAASPFAALRWGAAAAIVVAAHAGAAWVALEWSPASTVANDPPPAVTIDLAPLAVASPAPPDEIAPGPQVTEAQPEPTPDVVDPADDAVPDPAPPTETTEAVERDPPDPTPPAPPKPVEEAKPVPVPPPQPEPTVPELPKRDAAEAVLPAPAPPARPEHRERPVPKHEAARPRPVHRDRREVRRTTAPPSIEARRAEMAAAPASGQSRVPSVSPAAWKSALMARLNRYKRYPAGAAGSGTASVAFTIDRSGAVLASRLIGSSGDHALDQEAMSLPRRASPVPAPPPDLGSGRAITLTVPIRFDR